MILFSFQRPGLEAVGEKGWRILCQLRLYSWLGLVKDYRSYKNGLPEGYDPACVEGLSPPQEIVYNGKPLLRIGCSSFLKQK